MMGAALRLGITLTLALSRPRRTYSPSRERGQDATPPAPRDGFRLSAAGMTS